MHQQPSVSERVKQVLGRHCRAVLDRDIDTLGEEFDGGLTWVHATGAIDNKTTLLQKFANGDLNFSRHDLVDVEIVDLAGGVLATGWLEIDVVNRGEHRQVRNRISSVWKRIGDNYRLIHWQSTRAT